ncbi:TetR/AcrR family transcriptional regulator [Ferrimonas senticii]|uniref:TetR/AcrR family transcriptional regulator n=1 Tax=Ferrimonas senticii TaxID=394566 RepID=UPI0003FBB65A|nr:TetR/AcrR family transcriptional regulator [Ferrimonas senticii]
MSNRLTTKERILNAAERLFAERGFSETSLRLITSKAEVNLASVNYHFGSKKELIQAVLARYLDHSMPQMLQALNQLDSRANLRLDEVFEAMVAPLMTANNVRHNGTVIFLQLLGRGYIESQGHLRWFVTTKHGEVLQQMARLIDRAAPHVTPVEVFWRLHFSLGALVFTMSSFDALADIAAADFEQHNNVESVLRRVIPYLASGVSAPLPQLTEIAV